MQKQDIIYTTIINLLIAWSTLLFMRIEWQIMFGVSASCIICIPVAFYKIRVGQYSRLRLFFNSFYTAFCTTFLGVWISIVIGGLIGMDGIHFDGEFIRTVLFSILGITFWAVIFSFKIFPFMILAGIANFVCLLYRQTANKKPD